LASGALVKCIKDDCKVRIPGFKDEGEVDAEVPFRLFSCDAKSGGVYDYTLQQAAYAWGEMLKHFCTEWTVYMVYFDQRKVVTYRFTLERASSLVQEQINRRNNPPEPEINEYCGWCAQYQICPKVGVMVDKAMGHLTPEFDINKLKENPQELADWLTGASLIADPSSGLYPIGRKYLTDFLKKGKEVEGWKLHPRKGEEFVPVENLGKVWDLGIPLFAMVEAGGSMSDEKYFDLCSRWGVRVDESLIHRSGGNLYIRRKAKTKTKQEKAN
jgi:hypothetical protein